MCEHFNFTEVKSRFNNSLSVYFHLLYWTCGRTKILGNMCYLHVHLSICLSGVFLEIYQIFLMFGMRLEIYNPQKLKERTRPKIRLFRHFLKILSFEVFITLNENFCNSWFSIANLVFRKNLFFELCLNMCLTIRFQELLNLKK